MRALLSRIWAWLSAREPVPAVPPRWTPGRIVELFVGWNPPEGTELHLSYFSAMPVMIASLYGDSPVEIANEGIPVDRYSLARLDYPAVVARVKLSLTRKAERSLQRHARPSEN